MILKFHPSALDEFVAAAEYYDTAVPGLGNRFLVAVQHATAIALQHPESGSRRGTAARRLLVTGFPYDLVYRVRIDTVEVLAVAHQHRRPDYWRSRLLG